MSQVRQFVFGNEKCEVILERAYFIVILTCKLNFPDVCCRGMAVFAPSLLYSNVCTQPFWA